MNYELAKTLTTALVQFIDRDIPEGTMCCSNTECETLEKAFKADLFFYVEAFIQKKLLRLTEFEQEVSDIVEYCKEHGENVAFDYAKRHAKTLLALAKKELLKDDELAKKYLEGYIKGQEDAEKRYNNSVAYHYPESVPPGVVYKAPNNWNGDILGPEYNSGTPTVPLHDSTSATDGKEHNTSFTD